MSASADTIHSHSRRRKPVRTENYLVECWPLKVEEEAGEMKKFARETREVMLNNLYKKKVNL